MEWEKVKLGEVVSIKTGKLDANAAVEGGEYPFFTCAKEISRIDKFAFDCECVLVAGNGDLNVKYYKGKFNAYQRTYVIEVLNDKLYIKYLYYFLENYLDILTSKTIGGVIKYIKLINLQEPTIPLPPLSIQKEIVERLDKADALRQKDQELVAQYDHLAQALFIDLFGDPVTNEKGWERKKLGEVCSKIGSGATPKGGKNSYLSKGISLIRSLNVYDKEFKYAGLAFIDDKQANSLRNVVVEENDVLFNITGASVCRSCIVPSNVLPARVNQHVSILRCKKEVLNHIFLNSQLVFNSKKVQILALSKSAGATREAINKQQLENLEILLPPISLQNQFAEMIENIEAQKAKAKKQAEESENLFQALLQEAFGGK